MAVDEYVTKTELESKLKLHRNTISRLLASGRFPNAFRTGGTTAGHWRIPMRDVEAYVNERRGGKGDRP